MLAIGDVTIGLIRRPLTDDQRRSRGIGGPPRGGQATAAAIPDRQVAGKTGSTDENADAWFIGFTPQLSTAVWMGAPRAGVSMYNVGAVPRVYGGTYPARIFGEYMRNVLAEQPDVPFPPPEPPTRECSALVVP